MTQPVPVEADREVWVSTHIVSVFSWVLAILLEVSVCRHGVGYHTPNYAQVAALHAMIHLSMR